MPGPVMSTTLPSSRAAAGGGRSPCPGPRACPASVGQWAPWSPVLLEADQKQRHRSPVRPFDGPRGIFTTSSISVVDEQSHGFVARGSGWTLATEPPAAPWRPSPLRPDEGSATVGGTDILHAKGAAERALRRRIDVVFQDPFSSLNPLARVDTSISEPSKVHRLVEAPRPAATVSPNCSISSGSNTRATCWRRYRRSGHAPPSDRRGPVRRSWA